MVVLPRAVRTTLAAVALVSTTACDWFTGPDEPGFTVSFPVRSYAPGATVEMEVTNRSGRSWYYAWDCNRGFQRLIGTEWQDVYDEGGCLAVADVAPLGGALELSVAPVTIAPGESVVLEYFLPPNAVSGQHRIRFSLNDRITFDGRSVRQLSPEFLVLGIPLATAAR